MANPRSLRQYQGSEALPERYPSGLRPMYLTMERPTTMMVTTQRNSLRSCWFQRETSCKILQDGFLFPFEKCKSNTFEGTSKGWDHHLLPHRCTMVANLLGLRPIAFRVTNGWIAYLFKSMKRVISASFFFERTWDSQFNCPFLHFAVGMHWSKGFRM